MTLFFINSTQNLSRKHVSHNRIIFLTNSLHQQVTRKLKSALFTALVNCYWVFEMTLSSKHGTEKLKTKNQRYRSTKNQNTEREKPSFTKKNRQKMHLYKTVLKNMTANYANNIWLLYCHILTTNTINIHDKYRIFVIT